MTWYDMIYLSIHFCARGTFKLMTRQISVVTRIDVIVGQRILQLILILL